MTDPNSTPSTQNCCGPTGCAPGCDCGEACTCAPAEVVAPSARCAPPRPRSGFVTLPVMAGGAFLLVPLAAAVHSCCGTGGCGCC